MMTRRNRPRRGHLKGGHLNGREIRVSQCADEGAILVEHWPADGHRDAVALSMLPAEKLLGDWLDAHGAAVVWH